jgi:hypothetical protein
MLRRRADEPSIHFTKGVVCMVNFTDGKFAAVIESCETVRKLCEEQRDQK